MRSSAVVNVKSESSSESLDTVKQNAYWYQHYLEGEILYYGLVQAQNREPENIDIQAKVYFGAMLLAHVYQNLIFSEEQAKRFRSDYDKNKSDNLFVFMNTCRLWLVRLNRLLMVSGKLLSALGPVVFALKNFLIFIHFAEIGVVIYLPRLFFNLYFLGRHTIPGPWMNDVEKNLGFFLRLTVQWERLRGQILNDAVWAVINLTCLLVPPVISLPLTVSLYAFDLAMAIWGYYTAKSHIANLEQYKLGDLQEDLQEDVKNYAVGQVLWEKRNQIIIAAIFLVTMSVLLPGLSSPLVLMVIASLINVLLTTAQIVYKKEISAKTPQLLNWSLSERGSVETVDGVDAVKLGVSSDK